MIRISPLWLLPVPVPVPVRTLVRSTGERQDDYTYCTTIYCGGGWGMYVTGEARGERRKGRGRGRQYEYWKENNQQSTINNQSFAFINPRRWRVKGCDWSKGSPTTTKTMRTTVLLQRNDSIQYKCLQTTQHNTTVRFFEY